MNNNNNNNNNKSDNLNNNIIKKLEEDVSLKVRSSAVIVSLEQAIEEIVFNSIDAQATSIVISINLSNLTFEVKDNGFGINYGNFKTIGEHSCTSKINKLTDLKSLSTFGYRGESLASLSDVSNLDIVSTSNNNTVQKTFNFGKCEQFKTIDSQDSIHNKPISNGTVVKVRDLFKNFPVRRQNLFHPNLKLILKKRIEIIALSFPNIRFSVYDETKSLNILKTPKDTSFMSYFKHFYGQEMANKLEFIVSEGFPNEKSFYLSGYVSSPQKKGHPNKSFQYFYLNNRIVLNTKLHRHINQLYHKFRLFNATRRAHANTSKIPKKEVIDSNPIFILFLKCSQLEYERSYEPSSKTFLEFNDWKKPLGEIQNVITKFLTRFRENDTLLYENNSKRSDPSSALDVSIFEDSISDDVNNSQLEENEEDGFDLGYNKNDDNNEGDNYRENQGFADFFQDEDENKESFNNTEFLNQFDSKRKKEEKFINDILPDSYFLSEKPSPSKSQSPPFKSVVTPSKLSLQNISLQNNISPTKVNTTTTTTTTTTKTTTNTSPYKSKFSYSPTSSPTHSSQNYSQSPQNQSQTSIQLAQQFNSTLQPLSSSSSSEQSITTSSQSPSSSQSNNQSSSQKSSLKSGGSSPLFILANKERKSDRDEDFESFGKDDSILKPSPNKKFKQQPIKEDQKKKDETEDEINYIDFSLRYSDTDSEDTILENLASPPKPQPLPQKPSSYFSTKELLNPKDKEELPKPIYTIATTATTAATTETKAPIETATTTANLLINENVELSNSKAIVCYENNNSNTNNNSNDNNNTNKEIVPYVKREPNLLDEHHLANYNPTFKNEEEIVLRGRRGYIENSDEEANYNNKANYSLKVSSYREVIDLENDETTTITTTTTTIKSVKTVSVKKKGTGGNINHYRVKREHPILIKKEDYKELADNASTFSKSNETNDSLFEHSYVDIVPFEISDDESEEETKVMDTGLEENITPPSSPQASPPQASPLKNQRKQKDPFIKQENDSPTKKQKIEDKVVINLESDSEDYVYSNSIKSPPKATNTSTFFIRRENSENTAIFSKYFKSNMDNYNARDDNTSNTTPILRDTKLLNISTETDLPSTESAFSDDEYVKKKVTFDIDKNQFFSPPQSYYEEEEEIESTNINNRDEKETVYQIKKENNSSSISVKQEKILKQKKEDEDDEDLDDETNCPTHNHQHHNCSHEDENFVHDTDYSRIELMKVYKHNNNSISQYFDGRKNTNNNTTETSTNMGPFIKELLTQKCQEIIPREMLKDFKFITQWDKKFLVCEANGIVLVLDQHAVSERIKLETLEKKYFGENKFDLCPMPERSRWSLTAYELELMKIYSKNLEDWGFEWRSNPTSITILQVPMFCLVGLGVNDLREFLYLLENNKGSPSTKPPAAHRILASKACRTAIKFGHNLTKEVCIKLLEDLNECNIPFQCAHGRPSIIPLINYSSLFKNLNQYNNNNNNNNNNKR
ncbi:hypothetical protein DICPUDRAFT_153264 [Dictyostelium purpureum]|uniref:MutL C-terminal dimerisation domain-containing protein n=1 Tax=Dictyostelium purpureum TaxID=5786 RepID=F0ZNG3_DICPU|nr:uncharacterized protein DICPUDRAFT_153264 [Dictyostelium purpureum]EGC34526.1 hypothetical protein DICPUDRAFT_153264 [Dictyostelium purpureum]|eukprot:XP_003288962.1 hypothetical protein DICPUDRAFT_153264 [Dictyostelium purpureum]